MVFVSHPNLPFGPGIGIPADNTATMTELTIVLPLRALSRSSFAVNKPPFDAVAQIMLTVLPPLDAVSPHLKTFEHRSRDDLSSLAVLIKRA